jgi:NAD(P)-dependent dehydrogenase (short-subunit alcohol dehydrogenase family)
MSTADYTFDYDFKERPLAGRTILIAGGAGGLGGATSAMLARDGASLVIGYRAARQRAEAFKQALEARYKTVVRLVEGDITDEAARSRYVESAEEMGEGLYAVACFTGDPARVKFDDVTASDLEESFDRNYTAPLLLAREAAKRIRSRNDEGAIVFISSMQAVAAFESSVNYAGPKAALIHAARILAKQWGGPRGIRVNVIAPGVNRAGMAIKSIESGKYDFYIDEGIIPRFGRPEDVARVARLLVEPDNYITGQVITVDGGLTLRRDRG